MLKQWIPWKFLLKRTARAYGVIDPVAFLARLRRFSQPSEIQEPIELLRAGIEFHARGLINTKAIQHNLDWIWPFWVERQFNPDDVSFIPRAFTFSHVNLTHRNWTAVGLPTLQVYPIVDPRGLVTPLFDGWSIDTWITGGGGPDLFPSRLAQARQSLEMGDTMAVETRCESEGREIIGRCRVELIDGHPHLIHTVRANAAQANAAQAGAESPGEHPDGEQDEGRGGYLALALRPYNPEGIQFIESIAWEPSAAIWRVDDTVPIHLDPAPERVHFSNYDLGDVVHRLASDAQEPRNSIACRVGMATSAALYPLSANGETTVTLRVPLKEEVRPEFPKPPPAEKSWSGTLSGTATLRVPDPAFRFQYDAALRTLILLSAQDVVPGPYTYRRFWFRDAALMLNAIMAAGLTDRAGRILSVFPDRQKRSGYFQSQEGEWDSNGQTLWIMDRYLQLTGRRPDSRWMRAILNGVDWIENKRLPDDDRAPHAGLFPPGFSAEHLGPNDYYYWDDFWGAAGLHAAAGIVARGHSEAVGLKIEKAALNFERAIFRSIARIPESRTGGAIPAAPARRMDAGAIGSLVADYPLRLTPPGHAGIMKTVDFLMAVCFRRGGFFQDMIHSGINIYLTLDIAQTLLRAGDPRYRAPIRAALGMASPTGQWPEAIHPLTGGGCMGDGHHGWAAAEWVMMMRNLFIREEDDGLILGSGVFPEWLEPGRTIGFGPTPTPYGAVDLRLTPAPGNGRTLRAEVLADWRTPPPPIEFRVPGSAPLRVASPEPHAIHQLEQMEDSHP